MSLSFKKLFSRCPNLAWLLFTCAASITLVFIVYLSFFSTAAAEKASMERLRTCITDPQEVLSCGREEVLKLLKKRNAKETLELLSEHLTVGQCHTIGHLVGQETFKKYGDIEVALDQCGYGCTGSCGHGVIGEALIEELGLIPGSVDPQHLDVEYIKAAGGRLCQSRGMCHGVGHILFQIYNEFEKPLAICDEISSGGVREHCYRGVFMEHADTISTHNLLLGTERKQLRDPNNMRFPCDSVAERYQHSCLRYLPRIHAHLLVEMNMEPDIKERGREACESFSSPIARSACFEGYGFRFYGLVRTDVESAHRICDELSLESDRIACSLGIIYPVADFGEVSQALAFCKNVAGNAEKNMCYHAVFEAARYRVVPQSTFEELRQWCAVSDSECNAQLDQYAANPWDTVFGVRF